MLSLNQAVRSRLERDGKDGTASYVGRAVREWSIGAVPQGGYTLSIMTNAVQAFMRLPTNAKPEHFDPIHISATYYRQVAQEELRVDIKADKRGRGFSNITAELKQKPRKGTSTEWDTCILAHFIMTNFAALDADPAPTPTIPSDHALFVSCPLAPPEQCTRSNLFGGEKFKMRESLLLTEDLALGREASKKGELRWGGWMNLAHERDGSNDTTKDEPGMGNNTIPVFADMFANPVECLPKGLKPGTSWYPTMHLTIEFKRALPYAPSKSITAVGVVSTGRFINRGRHEVDAEVWSHPSDPIDGQSKPQILAISRQLALVMPMSVNERRKANKEAGSKL